MKTTIKYISIFVLLMTGLMLQAQTDRIQYTTLEYEDQRVDALSIDIQPGRKDVQDAFDDWMKDRYDVKMKGGGLFGDKNMETSEAATIPTISSDNISILTKTEEFNGYTRMTLFASRGLNNFVDRENFTAFSGLETLFDSFLSDYLPNYYEERVAEAEEALSDLQEDYDDVEKDIRKNEEDIEKLQSENVELRNELEELRRKLNDAQDTLRKRRSARQEIARKAAGNRF